MIICIRIKKNKFIDATNIKNISWLIRVGYMVNGYVTEGSKL